MAILSSPIQYISSIPPATRGVTVLLVAFPAAYWWLSAGDYQPAPYLVVIPNSTLLHPWTLLTAPFVELSPFNWIFSFVTVALACRYLERLWGTLEMIKFSFITLVLSNFIAVALSWLVFLVFGRAEWALTGTYWGMSALQTGVLVAFTQLIPEHQVQIFGVLKIRVKNVPMVYVTISTILCLVGLQSPWILVQFGWLVSWIYLRFYKKNTSETGAGGESYGDRSETFAFVHWFPPFLHYPISLLSNTVYNVAVRLRLIRAFSASPPDLENAYSSTPGGARAEAERRRAMALKALDQRVASNVNTVSGNAASGSAVALPSLAAQDAASPRPSEEPHAESAPASQSAPEQDGKGKGKATEAN